MQTRIFCNMDCRRITGRIQICIQIPVSTGSGTISNARRSLHLLPHCIHSANRAKHRYVATIFRECHFVCCVHIGIADGNCCFRRNSLCFGFQPDGGQQADNHCQRQQETEHASFHKFASLLINYFLFTGLQQYDFTKPIPQSKSIFRIFYTIRR